MICHTIKTEIAYGKFWKRRTIISSFCFGCWTYENLAALVSQVIWLFQLFPASSKFPKFSSLWFSFSSRHSCYSCSFSSFLASALVCRHRRGCTNRYGLIMELCSTGKIWKPWYARTNCQILVKFENKNLDYVSLKNKKRVNKIHSTSSV